MERWGRKLNAFHKQQLPSHLLQLATSEQTGNSSLNKKKVQPRWSQQKLFGVAWLAFTQQLLVYTRRPVHDSMTATGTENQQHAYLFYILTKIYITLRPRDLWQFMPASVEHNFCQLLLLFTLTLFHFHSSNSLKLTVTLSHWCSSRPTQALSLQIVCLPQPKHITGSRTL